MDWLKRIETAGIVPVVVIEHEADAIPTAKALLCGGIDVMEITFRTDAAPEAIRQVAKNCPEMLVGAGTVLTLQQCETAVACGAKFIVSPGFDPAIVHWCMNRSVPIVPGCVTPSEIMAAQRAGLHVVKFFPANVYGGMNAIKSLSSPFPDMRFLPTGGVNADNLAQYLSADCVVAVGGSWLCTKNDIAAGNFDRIAELAASARAVIAAI